MGVEKNCCYQSFHPFVKEFQTNKFSLKHQPVDDFCKSQWQKHTKSWLWLIYRWCLAAFFLGGVIASLVQLFFEGKWFIYLTDWGIILCMLASVLGAFITTIYQFKPDYFVPGSRTLQCYWALHWSALVLATIITSIYWIFVFTIDDTRIALVYNLGAHAFNSFFMLLDHMLVAFPARILHFIYPSALGLLYAIFTAIYYFAGGVDIDGNDYIYSILDWSEPGIAIASVFGCFILVFIYSCILFVIYKLRTYIYRKCNNSVLALNA